MMSACLFARPIEMQLRPPSARTPLSRKFVGRSPNSTTGLSNRERSRSGPGRIMFFGRGQRYVQPRALHRELGFDIVHHLTWGGVRAPTFLGSLGPPLIIGPVGGGETSPRSLRDGFRLKSRVLESIRDLSNLTIRINPLVRGGLANAAAIFAKTPDTLRLMNGTLRKKTGVFLELGIRQGEIGSPRTPRQTPPRLLYAGRLLYWKGVHIAIQAFSKILIKIPSARLTIISSGPEESGLKSDVIARKVNNNVDIMSWISQDELFRLYDTHDLLLFPSLHDSSGGVVLEALCHGMPVVCLDLGGPKEIVTPNSGVIIKTAGLNTAQVASRIADEIHALLVSPATLAKLSAGAISRAHDFLFPNRVAEFYREAQKFIEDRRGSSAPSVAQS